MPPLHIRRATVDDLPALKSLWLTARLPADELEARLTEFQVVEAGGVFAGALGLQIVRQHARLHSEDYADFSVADAARELFLERLPFSELSSKQISASRYCLHPEPVECKRCHSLRGK